MKMVKDNWINDTSNESTSAEVQPIKQNDDSKALWGFYETKENFINLNLC